MRRPIRALQMFPDCVKGPGQQTASALTFYIRKPPLQNKYKHRTANFIKGPAIRMHKQCVQVNKAPDASQVKITPARGQVYTFHVFSLASKPATISARR